MTLSFSFCLIPLLQHLSLCQGSSNTEINEEALCHFVDLNTAFHHVCTHQKQRTTEDEMAASALVSIHNVLSVSYII